ncbi:GEVED domain-containing protein [Hymenobacter gummosus]|nr:GEVED domain-containing protein [Hymenobacter gummosus]
MWMLYLASSTSVASAQCPPPATCQPGNAPATNHAFGMGIYRVTLAGLDTATAGAAQGYQDYGCRARAALLGRGGSYALAVRTNPNADETVRAWLDYNNDGQFGAGELVLSSANARQHAATFTVPATAPVGVALRLRIAADYSLAPVPGPCTTPQYSQTEDYRVVLLATAPARPQARFLALDTVSCGGPISFRDQSLHAPAQWLWRFGDGASSSQQHPQHQYAQPGTYTVRLTACNAAGCDSLTRTGYVTVRADAPRPAPCQPATTAHCCGYGLTRVRLAGLDNRSLDGQAGYEDFSCARRATLTADRPATLQLSTAAVAHDVRVWLDVNDDGQLAPAELLYQGLAVQSPSVTLSIPASTAGLVYGRPLRLRLLADFAGSPATGPCAAPQLGQVEDYSVVLAPNLAPPAAAFAVAYQQLCGPVRVSFANQTTGAATAYHWDFGDGTSSTLAAPPPHTYARPGLYEVRLVAQNAAGPDTAWQRVAVAEACPTYCTPLGNGGTNSAPAYFTSVRLGDINNTVPRTTGVAYRDFTDQYTTLQIGQSYQFAATSPPYPFGGSNHVTCWLDANQDGFFTASEILGTVNNVLQYQYAVRVPAAAKAGPTRLRVMIHYGAAYVDATTCSPAWWPGSTEDYTVVVLPAAGPPAALFSAELPTSCSGTVQFRDSTESGPTRWLWRFGDGDSATVQHPRHTYAAPGTYTVSLTVSNRLGTSTRTRPGYVTIRSLGGAPAPLTACRPAVGVTEAQRGIRTFSIGTALSYGPQPLNAPSYRDETCAVPPAVLARGVLYAMTMADRYNPATAAFVWVDVNDDGRFDATELLYDALQFPVFSPTVRTGTLTLPPATVLNRPLRLRVLFAYPPGNQSNLTAIPSPCYTGAADQARDFTIIATASTATAAGAGAPAWQVYPNPATGHVSVRGDFRQPTVVELCDVRGRVVLRQSVPPVSGALPLQLQALPRGLYLLRLPATGQAARLVLE